MGGGLSSPTNQRHELCTPSGTELSTAHLSGIELGGTAELRPVARNEQQIRKGQSCWQTLVAVANASYGIQLILEPSGITAEGAHTGSPVGVGLTAPVVGRTVRVSN